MINKTESRKKAISQRDQAYSIEKSRKIIQRICQAQIFKSASTVFVYVSTGSEPETREILSNSLRLGKRVLVPYITAPGQMQAVQIQSLADLEPGFLGIDAPKDPSPIVDPALIDLAIIPGLLFSLSGDRLGYGGGFYDRFCERMRKDCLRVALLFDESIGEVPSEAHDQKVDVLCTPSTSIETGAYDQRNASIGSFIASKGKFGMRLGLETIQALLDKLDHPEIGLPIVHIAGTNGKGSMTTLLSTIAREAGYCVGTFTSPALESFNERIQVNGVPISDDEIERLYEPIRKAINEMVAQGCSEPTGFEIETALAYLYFKEKNVDLVCLEVGLGGRLDATNSAKDPLLCIIGSISLEHTQYLGDTKEKIASEKAGIFKKGANAVFYPNDPSVLSVLRKKAQELGIQKIYEVNPNVLQLLSIDEKGQRLLYQVEGEEPTELTLALRGSHQILNAATVLCAVKALEEQGFIFPRGAVERAFKSVRFPGRMETLSKKPHLLIDGAHNEDGIKKLSENLKREYQDRPIDLYFGMLEDKNVDLAISSLVPLADRIYPMMPNSPEALSSEEMKKRIEQYGRSVDRTFENTEDAVLHALEQSGRYSIFTGSLYLIGEIRKAFHSVLTK